MNAENNDTPEEVSFNTEQQRRALDAMSADLVRKLHEMIDEQNTRVQEFAALNQAFSELNNTADAPRQAFPGGQPTPSSPAETPAPSSHAGATPAARRSVTPPPIQKIKKAPRPQHQAPPAQRRSHPGTGAKEEKKSESSIGCGTIAFAVFVIIMILRSCN